MAGESASKNRALGNVLAFVLFLDTQAMQPVATALVEAFRCKDRRRSICPSAGANSDSLACDSA